MLLIDLNKRTFESLQRETLKQAGLLERRDIQDLICRTPGPFCLEISDYIHIVGSEIQPTDVVQDRIDILGVDRDGAAVIIEIKRSNHKLHLLQAIAYAAMISKWTERQFVEKLRDYNRAFHGGQQSIEEANDELVGILDEGDVASINKYQRILLIAEEFDYEVLATAEWLTEFYDMDIRCIRMELAKLDERKFLSFTPTYPPPELTEVAKRRRRRTETGVDEALGWKEFLEQMDNPAAISFFSDALESGFDDNPGKKLIKIRDHAGIRFRVSARRQFATVVQNGRFDQDESFWRQRLSAELDLRSRRGGKGLAFRLSSENDFSQFKEALQSLKDTKFFQAIRDSDVESETDGS